MEGENLTEYAGLVNEREVGPTFPARDANLLHITRLHRHLFLLRQKKKIVPIIASPITTARTFPISTMISKIFILTQPTFSKLILNKVRLLPFAHVLFE